MIAILGFLLGSLFVSVVAEAEDGRVHEIEIAVDDGSIVDEEIDD